MNESILNVLADLTDPDIDWLLTAGTEQQVISGSVLTQAGQVPDALRVVLEGLLAVRVAALNNKLLRTLGPGELIGEMSFLDGEPASATVTALESSLLLVLPRATLDLKLASDPAFASRFHRALARLLSRRLRHVMVSFGQRLDVAASRAQEVSAEWSTASIVLADFKRTLVEADVRALRAGGEVPAGVVADVRERFTGFWQWLNGQLGEESPYEPEVREELGARMQRELLPYIILTRSGERWYSKPRGYAGDFLTIEWVYEDEPGGSSRLGPLLDRCFLDLPAAKAVRNRRKLLGEEIRRTIAGKETPPVRVLSLACGPARELFDTYAALPDPSTLSATCIDIDLQALAFVGDLRDRRKLQRAMRLENANLVYLATGRQKLDIAPQDLAYSIGLIDYFNDGFVVRLLNWIHDRLRPGGRAILGNFHPRNPARAFMDYVLDWKLIHRTEDDMNRLFAESRFGAPCEEIRFEDQGVNLFAIGRKRE